jgi:predicted transcriptional regulator
MEITVKVPDALAARAQSSGVAPDVYVERLLNAIADAASRESIGREQLCEELKADWEHFKATGLHLDEEEVDLWLAGLEAGHDSGLPELHI